MNTFFKIVCVVILFFMIGGSFWLGGGIPFKEQMPIYDGLRSTSAIIFAVMGAWIALLYPRKLSQVFGNKTSNEGQIEADQIKRLFRPMIYSTVILMVVIGMSFFVPLAKQIPALCQYKEIFRAGSFALIGALTCIQLWSLIITLLPGDQIKDDLDQIQQREEMLDRMRPGKRNNNE